MTAAPSRRRVLQGLGLTALAASGALGGCTPAAPAPASSGATSPAASPSTTAAAEPFRFATASDGHLGQKGTDSRRYLDELVAALNRTNAATPLAFAGLNGDLGQGGVELQREVKAGLDGLDFRWFATQGNHDEVSAAEWQQVWGERGDFVQRFGDRSVIGANTSNQAGDYLCADVGWLRDALAGEAGQRDVFVFMHITPDTWTKFGVDCPDVRRALAAAENVRAVFNGHDHDQAGLKTASGVPYLFDAHYGGGWGTKYRAFRMVEVGERSLTTWLVTLDGDQRKPVTLDW